MLSPMIRELATSTGMPSCQCGSLRNPISVMLSEHNAVGDLLARLRRLTDGYSPPADGCASYLACFAAMVELEADTHLHIHKENNVLFRAVVQLDAERAAVVRARSEQRIRYRRPSAAIHRAGATCSRTLVRTSSTATTSSYWCITSTETRRWTMRSTRCSKPPT